MPSRFDGPSQSGGKRQKRFSPQFFLNKGFYLYIPINLIIQVEVIRIPFLLFIIEQVIGVARRNKLLGPVR
jgi:hypothetical protein